MQNKDQHYCFALMQVIIINMYYIVSGSIEIPTVLHDVPKLIFKYIKVSNSMNAEDVLAKLYKYMKKYFMR